MKSKFVSDGSDDPNIIIIKERKFPWWILLLLLPLILLIPISRTVHVQISEQGTQMPVAYEDAKLTYPHRGTFGGFEYRDVRSTTDSLGKVDFEVASQPLWVVLFVKSDTASVSCTNGCYAGTYANAYHKYPRNEYLPITIPPVVVDITIQVVDAENSEPLPDCDVEIRRSFAGDKRTDNAHTDEAGNVYIAGMPICGQLTVTACRDGFACDSIKGIAGDIANDSTPSARIIRLRPLKASICVIVRDLKTNDLLPDATVTLILGGQTTSFRTNTNGVGIGMFDEQRILETMELAASKPNYHDTTMTDIGTVRDFVNRDAEGRTMRLRPITKNLEFINTDGANPLANVKNEVYVNGTLRTTVMSNRNGRFTVTGIRVDDVITIISSKAGYNTNDTKVKDKPLSALDTQDSRTIPLSRNLVFINTDGTNPLAGVKNEIYVNGALRDAVYSGNDGKFTVPGLMQTDVISIVASKTGYNTNSTKVKNKTLADLDTQDSRTIPLDEIPAPPPPPPPQNNTPDLQGQSGDLRINLQWETACDLDLHVTDPCGNEIYFSNTRGSCHGGIGTLDVDANAGGRTHAHPQENIYWLSPAAGNYKVVVVYYARRVVSGTVPFSVSIIDQNGRRNFRGVARTKGEKIFIATHTVNN